MISFPTSTIQQTPIWRPCSTALFASLVILILTPFVQAADSPECQPTRPDMLGPFYEPDAPVRDNVGTGYLLSGTVRAAGNCDNLPEAKIELWLVGPDGRYGDDFRATLFSDDSGRYRFESHPPPGYYGRPPHIHIKVTAIGYQTLITQHYPQSGQTEAVFDLVLKAE